MTKRKTEDNFVEEVLRLRRELPPSSRKLVRQVIAYLRENQVSSFDALREVLLHGNNNDLKVAVCFVARNARWKSLANVLLKVFEAEQVNDTLIWEAAKTIGLFKPEEAIEVLSETLQNNVKLSKRKAAAYALGITGDIRAMRPLLDILNAKHESVDLRQHAAEALASFRKREAIDGLIHNLEDDDPGVRFWAAFALGRIGSIRALRPLGQIQSDESSVGEWGSVGSEATAAINAILGTRNSPTI